jgi:hypothetical protein
MRPRRLRACLLISVLAALNASGSVAQPFSVGGDPRVNPAEFWITTFATGLDGPFSMQELSDGSLLVATAGGLLRLVDSDKDGVADGPGTLLHVSPGYPITGLRIVGDLVFMSQLEKLSILRLGASPSSPLTVLTSFDIEIVQPWSHITHTLAVRELGAGLVELYFNVGSKDDAVATAGTVPVTGALTGSVMPDSIYRVIVDDTGPSVAVSGLEMIASGVRNAFGIAFHAPSGHLLFEDDNIDGPVAPFELGAGELNIIAAPDVGGSVEDFGFPDNYFAYRTNVEVGSGGIDPIVTFQPLPPPNGVESEGAAEIAFAPPGFPAGFNDGLFVAFHGAGETVGATNLDNPLVYVDLGTLEYFHFV